MRTFEYVEPGPDDQPVTVRRTEEWIRENYYPYWQSRMRERGFDLGGFGFEDALDDYIVCHWATEVKDGM
jgi:hypothetical protein